MQHLWISRVEVEEKREKRRKEREREREEKREEKNRRSGEWDQNEIFIEMRKKKTIRKERKGKR